ncbi:NADP(H)-dependent aldo-keto reductase [Motiliproteus sp.]|uniref:NADP(H)-dependent aldo-keto reductase n=1 Tax=Motiliproteus sp. TaxID=1898955 RepID=UPI003BAA2930
MQYQTLGRSDLKVSRICLGTMTWGEQNSEAEAFEQLDLALDRGVNFFDTAELYPIPPKAATQGETERIIGRWLKARSNRDRCVLASKVAGPGDFVRYIRPNLSLSRDHIRQAIQGSLTRLGVDYLDLYQLHWPDRATNFFGQLGYTHQPEKDGAPLLESLQALAELIDEGLVRQIGVSNETPWGVMRLQELARTEKLPMTVTVQNPYNLLNRSTEVGLAEVLQREQIDLLPYSPLGFGVLSGKYLDGGLPKGSRLQLYPNYRRYVTERGVEATRAYVELAREYGQTPSQMALAFVNSRPFVGSTIIGATTMEQLRSNIDSIDLHLGEEQLKAIEAIHARYPIPCP